MEGINSKNKKFYQTSFKRHQENKLEEIRRWLRSEADQNSKSLSISDIMVNHAVGYNLGKKIYLQLQSEGIIDGNGDLL